MKNLEREAIRLLKIIFVSQRLLLNAEIRKLNMT